MLAEIAYLVLLVAVGYLYVLNLHLRGRITKIIEYILAIVLLALFIVAFFLFHWSFAILCVVLTFAFTNLIIPTASRCAYRILGFRTGVDEPDLSSYDLLVKGKISFLEYSERCKREDQRTRSKLTRLTQRADIARVLEDNNISIDDYVVLYQDLRRWGLSDLAWDIISNPDDLALLILLKREGKSPVEVSYSLRRKGERG